jgi:hypothetical protein
MIHVLNKKIDRGGHNIARPSILGNPFIIGRDGDRDTVIARYSLWLKQEYVKGGEVYEEIHRLAALYKRDGVLRLSCFCKPAPCHGDILAKAISAVAATL